MRDPYETLGLTRTADADEIKASYFAQVSQVHPDRCPGDEAAAVKFRELTEAYEILGVDERRERFDSGESTTDTGEMPPGVVAAMGFAEEMLPIGVKVYEELEALGRDGLKVAAIGAAKKCCTPEGQAALREGGALLRRGLRSIFGGKPTPS
jgi:curved DNA-binding protein CbpA